MFWLNMNVRTLFFFDTFTILFIFYFNYFVNISDTEIVTAVSWTPDSQLISCSDDKTMVKWGADGEKNGNIPIKELNIFVTNISWFRSINKQVISSIIKF